MTDQWFRALVYLFVASFVWAAFSMQLTFVPYAPGMAVGKIHYVPKCAWLAKMTLGSWQSRLPTQHEWQEIVEEFGRCNLQSGDGK